MDRAADPPRLPPPRGAGPSRPRELFFRAFALGLGLAAGLLGMEGLARLVLTDFYACDPALGWTFEPGRAGWKLDRRLEYAVRARINSAGFHDVEHALEKPPGTVRVVVLGDSMLAGMQVPLEQSFVRRLEALLNEGRESPRFEVVSCATDGFGTAQALLMFEERCRHYEPDLVLLGFFATNDVLDNYWGARSLNHPVARKCGRPYLAREDGRLVRVGALLPAVSDPSTSWLDRALRRSYLYQAIAPPPGGGESTKFRVHDVYRIEYPPELEEAWTVTQGLLLALDETVRRYGAALGVLFVPSRSEIFPDRAPHPEQLDLGRPARILGGFLAERGLAHVDLAPGLRERADGTPLYFERDMHWTGPGNGAAGELVARWVRALYSRGSAPEAPPWVRAPSPAPESSSTTGPPPGPRC